jgi:signal transduction histidine kinase
MSDWTETDRGTDDLAPGSFDSASSHVFLLLEHEENSRLLSSWLADHYDVTRIDSPAALAQDPSLCIIDEGTYARHGQEVRDRRADGSSAFLPLLLTCSRSLSSLDPAVWNDVDEVISTPVDRAELKMRVDGLLERYHQFERLRRRQRSLESLHDAFTEMIRADAPERICQLAVVAADQALDLPLTAAWLVDDSGSRLEPVAQTDECARYFDDLPTYEASDESVSWRAYEDQQPRVFEDLTAAVSEAALANPATPIQSELVLPLGEFGVLNCGSPSPREFDESDVYGARLLAASTAIALDRSERERTLTRQNSQMEFFTSILRHDVLNAMTVITTRANVLASELERDRHRESAETIQEWSGEVVDVVQRVRSVLQTLTAGDEAELEPRDVGAVLRGELDRIRDTYPAVDVEHRLPDDVWVVADELVSEVFKNVLTNAVEHNDPSGLHLSTTVEADGEAVTVRVADDGVGVPDDRKDAIFRRGETGHAKSTGSGFGLFFVETMLQKYGGSVRVEDNEPRGAAFVVRLRRVTDE